MKEARPQTAARLNRERFKRQPSRTALVLVAIGVALYANSLHSPFVFDDLASIPQNPSIRQLWPLTIPLSPPHRGEAVAGRPVVNLSLAMNYAAGGLQVSGYHVLNLGLHISCALLLFAILNLTINDELIAFVCALIWMVHPLQTEVVDYTVARTESMMALCLLATLYCAIRGWTVAAIACCAVGMACKETMVVAPILVPLWDACYRSSRSPRAISPSPQRRLLYGGLAATWLLLVAILLAEPRAHSAGFLASEDPTHPAGAWTYFLNQTVLITHYLRLAVWPSGLVLDYGLPQALTASRVFPQLVLLIALASLALIALIRWPAIGFWGAWFFLTLAPSSSVVPVATEVGAERRMYLPLIALVVGAVLLARTTVQKRPKLAWVAIGTIAVLCCGFTLRRNREYASALTLWSTNVSRWPGGRARVNLASTLQAAGRDDEVLPELQAAVGDFPEARYELGTQLIARGQLENGVQQLEIFVRQFPTHPQAAATRAAITGAQTQIAAQLTDRAIASASANRLDEAVPAFRRVVALLPQSGSAHRNLANALLAAGDHEGAIVEAREALRLAPTDSVAKEILELASRSR